MTRVALLPSPLLGPVVWSGVAVLLRERGHLVTEVELPDRVGSVADVLDGFSSQLPGSEPVVLVPHSNAGLYVAALAARRPVAAVVFADALVPGPDPATPTTSPGLRAMLADLADEEGLLPPWTRWWPGADTDALFPDAETRQSVERAEPRLPYSYFEEARAVAAGLGGPARGVPRVRRHLRRGAGRGRGGGAGRSPRWRGSTCTRWWTPRESGGAGGAAGAIRGCERIPVDLSVGPTWVRFVAPCGCPAHILEPRFVVLPGMGFPAGPRGPPVTEPR